MACQDRDLGDRVTRLIQTDIKKQKILGKETQNNSYFMSEQWRNSTKALYQKAQPKTGATRIGPIWLGRALMGDSNGTRIWECTVARPKGHANHQDHPPEEEAQLEFW